MQKPLISFDYAIKYLLRNKGDYDIVEGFISALLATEGYAPVKITAVLDAESNREALEQKKSIADLIVEDTNGDRYIIEIDRSFTMSFAHKAQFNTSRLVVDSLKPNQDYRHIKKIIHISLLYFDIRGMSTAITHGRTIFHEIDTAHPIPLEIAVKNQAKFEVHNVFPEYFFISVPKFDDIVHQEIDEWLYVAKNHDVPEGFKSKSMNKVLERLKILKMNDEQRNAYYKYMKDLVTEEDHYSSAWAEGEAKGKAEGLLEGKAKAHEDAGRKMLQLGADKSFISQITGLSFERIEQLEKEMRS